MDVVPARGQTLADADDRLSVPSLSYSKDLGPVL